MKRPFTFPQKVNEYGFPLAKLITFKRIVLVFLLLGIVSRLVLLGDRPFHHDESLDAWFSLRFLEGNFGGYDPVYHGPLRFYVTAALFWLFGESDLTARLLAAISGVLIIYVPWFWRKQIGSVGTVATIGLIVLSPSMLYFSRFGREDMFFLLVTSIFVILLFAFLEYPKGWHPSALLSFLVVGLAIKESVLLSIFLFGVFLLLLLIQENLVISSKRNQSHQGVEEQEFKIRRWTLFSGLTSMIAVLFWVGDSGGNGTLWKLALYGGLLLALATGSAVLAVSKNEVFPSNRIFRALRTPTRVQWLLTPLVPAFLFIGFFSQFFTSFSGPNVTSAPHGALRNGLTAGFTYWASQQKEGSRGDSRWQYYLTLLSAYEWFVLFFALFGIWQVFRQPNLFGQITLWWAGGNIILYSWASERMPWLIIHPLFPTIILSGLGVQFLWRRARGRKYRDALIMAFSICAIFSTTQSFVTNYSQGGDPQELFVQAGQATPEVKAWSSQLYRSDLAHFAESGDHLIVLIDSDVYWPYGWYLRDFPTSTYAIIEEQNIPDMARAPDVVIVPYWDTERINLSMEEYEIFPYNHRWWWVPEFDGGASNFNQFPQVLSRWGNWLWNREPWADLGTRSSKCPASLTGNVFVKRTVIEESREYGLWANPQETELPTYDNGCNGSSFLR